jgi:RNA polymerase sigma-70 factor (ECF subfamily)
MDTLAPGGPRLAHPVDGWAQTLARLQAFVAARVGDPETAADITQDVIARTIASGALDRVDNPIGWLYRTARNAVIDHYRTRRRLAPLDGWLDDVPDTDTDDDRPNRATRELARCLQPLVDQLAPIYRDAVTRVDLDGQTHQQAADQLGISVSGMKSRVQRGRRQLEEMLTRCCAVHLDRSGAVAGFQPGGTACGCAPS